MAILDHRAKLTLIIYLNANTLDILFYFSLTLHGLSKLEYPNHKLPSNIRNSYNEYKYKYKATMVITIQELDMFFDKLGMIK